MNRKIILLMLLAFGLLAASLPTLAQTGGYDLTWYTVSGGGYTMSQGGGYGLGGSIGLPWAGTLSGGGYSMMGGFWGAFPTAGPPHVQFYLPLVVKD